MLRRVFPDHLITYWDLPSVFLTPTQQGFKKGAPRVGVAQQSPHSCPSPAQARPRALSLSSRAAASLHPRSRARVRGPGLAPHSAAAQHELHYGNGRHQLQPQTPVRQPPCRPILVPLARPCRAGLGAVLGSRSGPTASCAMHCTPLARPPETRTAPMTAPAPGRGTRHPRPERTCCSHRVYAQHAHGQVSTSSFRPRELRWGRERPLPGPLAVAQARRSDVTSMVHAGRRLSTTTVGTTSALIAAIESTIERIVVQARARTGSNAACAVRTCRTTMMSRNPWVTRRSASAAR